MLSRINRHKRRLRWEKDPIHVARNVNFRMAFTRLNWQHKLAVISIQMRKMWLSLFNIFDAGPQNVMFNIFKNGILVANANRLFEYHVWIFFHITHYSIVFSFSCRIVSMCRYEVEEITLDNVLMARWLPLIWLCCVHKNVRVNCVMKFKKIISISIEDAQCT